MTRVACVLVPLFPLAARLRSEPDLKGEAAAVVEGNGHAARVVAATRPARKAGVLAGQTLLEARALLPGLVARGRDRESERAAQEALLEVADSFSPRVEDAGEGVVFFDADGLDPHFETQNSKFEISLGRNVMAAVEKSGMPARVGIAASKLAARVAAEQPESPTVVVGGDEARFLGPLPLSRLAPELEIAATLERWGLRAIADLARLPEGEVTSRLGETGRALHARARGIDLRPLEPRLPPLSLSEGMDLEWPLATLEPFLFLGHAALERLIQRLGTQALACVRLEIALRLDPDGHDARAIALPAPTRDVKTLLTLTRLELESRPPGAPVTGFTFTARPDKPRRAQLSLFGPAALSPDRLATTIARLAALLGAERIGSPRALDGHRPERFRDVAYAPPPPPDIALAPRGGRGLLAVRVLRPPVPLEVITEERGARLGLLSIRSVPNGDGPQPQIQGTVRIAAGPWSLEEGWWSEAPATRDYWDVELSEGGLYRVYRDRGEGGWFADGMYD